MYAIISIGGKQYKIKEKQTIITEKINTSIKKKININNILLIFTNNKIIYLKKEIKKYKITAKIISHIKGKKINIIKFKRRKHHKKQQGHRQKLTKIKIEKIIKENKNGT